MNFDWDKIKAEANFRKHGVSFDEAKTVFDDLFYTEFYDEKHSLEEHRYIIIGESAENRLLIVSYTDRDDIIRLISARELTPQEKRDYEQHRFE